MNDSKADETIKDIVKRRIRGVYIDGELCPINYTVSQNAFTIAVSGRIKAYRRNALVALLLQEVDEIQRNKEKFTEDSK